MLEVYKNPGTEEPRQIMKLVNMNVPGDDHWLHHAR